MTVDGEIDYFAMIYYDNLDAVVETQRYDTTSAGNLIGVSATNFNDRGRVYQQIGYAVDPTTGDVGNGLTDNFWYDPAGNSVMSLPAGSSLYTKTTFDSLNRPTVQYRGYNLSGTSYADAFSVTDDVVLQQVELTFDDASNVVQTTTRERYHNAPNTQTGPLQDRGTTPKARVTSIADYPDALGRLQASANYGTNGGTALTPPTTIPASSDTVLVFQPGVLMRRGILHKWWTRQAWSPPTFSTMRAARSSSSRTTSPENLEQFLVKLWRRMFSFSGHEPDDQFELYP